MKEEALLFGEGAPLCGVLSSRGDSRSKGLPAIVLSNPGLVHRVGPGRLYVRLARTLSERGFTVLRFDFSGVGDSEPRRDDVPFDESSVSETQDAFRFLQTVDPCESYVVLGLCAGAMTSFRTALIDERVVGVAAINPIFSTAGISAYVQGRRLWTRTKRMAVGRSRPRRREPASVGSRIRKSVATIANALEDRKRTLSEMQEIRAGLRSLIARGVDVLMVSSLRDPSHDYLELLFRGGDARRLRSSERLSRATIEGADHTFTSLSGQKLLLKVVEAWVDRCAAERRTGGAVPEAESTNLSEPI